MSAPRVDTEWFDEVRKRAGRLRVGPDFGALITYAVGDYVWSLFGQTNGILLARVLSAEPVAIHSISHVRDFYSVEVFAGSLGIWNPRPGFRRLLRKLTETEIDQLRGAKVIR